MRWSSRVVGPQPRLGPEAHRLVHHSAGLKPGRLLLWDESRCWWVVHEPDLELAVICAPHGIFREEPDQLSWWHFGTAEGRQKVEQLRVRYGIIGERRQHRLPEWGIWAPPTRPASRHWPVALMACRISEQRWPRPREAATASCTPNRGTGIARPRQFTSSRCSPAAGSCSCGGDRPVG